MVDQMNGDRAQNRVPVLLFLLRLSVVAVMIPWSIDKIIRPDHAAAVYERFYYLSGFGAPVFQIIGVIQLAIVAGFLVGLAKKWTYGAVLIMHTISTLSSWQQYVAPYQGSNLLFFAAWPMLAGCIMLFMMRDEDRFMTVGS